jgi:F0F1-type ATP synthase assembly protein I
MAEEPRPPAEGEDVPVTSGLERQAAADAESASWYRMAGVGVEFVVAIGAFAALGWWLDGKFGSSPWLVIAGCGIGFVVGLWGMVKAAGKMMG